MAGFVPEAAHYGLVGNSLSCIVGAGHDQDSVVADDDLDHKDLDAVDLGHTALVTLAVHDHTAAAEPAGSPGLVPCSGSQQQLLW